MARIKYYNSKTGKWEYADSQFVTGTGGSADLAGYATEEFVKNKIAEAELSGSGVDLSGFVQKSELTTQIQSALAQAKATGEFDGKDGVDGADGKDGKDGYTPQKGVDYFDGQPGKDGEDGSDGYSPIRGTDYWTPGDIAQIEDYVKDAVLENARKYGRLVIFGDSVGKGENNGNYSYADILEESGLFTAVVKACVSGAAIGPYGGPAGYDLNSQIERYASDVRDADIILCEYGGNDLMAMIGGTIEMGSASDDSSAVTVCGYTQKAIDRIRELNPGAKLHWVNVLPDDWDFNAAGQEGSADGSDLADAILLFMATVMRKVHLCGVYTIQAPYMVPQYLSSDNIHPNTPGHRNIAEMILCGLFRHNVIFPKERLVTLNGTLADPSTLSVNGKYAYLCRLLEAGIPLRMIGHVAFDGGITTLELGFSWCNSYAVAFVYTAFNGTDPKPTFVEIRIAGNDTCEMLSCMNQ